MDELKTMVSRLGQEGTLDSSGVFTLNLRSVRKKLVPYRLVNPGLFVLNLVAAAAAMLGLLWVNSSRSFAILPLSDPQAALPFPANRR